MQNDNWRVRAKIAMMSVPQGHFDWLHQLGGELVVIISVRSLESRCIGYLAKVNLGVRVSCIHFVSLNSRILLVQDHHRARQRADDSQQYPLGRLILC